MNESSTEDGYMQSEPINSFYPVLKFANHIVSQEKIAQKDAIRPHQIRLFQPELPLHEDKQTLHLTFDIKKVNITTDYSIVPNFIIAILPTSWTRIRPLGSLGSTASSSYPKPTSLLSNKMELVQISSIYHRIRRTTQIFISQSSKDRWLPILM